MREKESRKNFGQRFKVGSMWVRVKSGRSLGKDGGKLGWDLPHLGLLKKIQRYENPVFESPSQK